MPLYNEMSRKIKELEAENKALKAVVTMMEHGVKLKEMRDAGDIRGFNRKMSELTQSKIKDGYLSLGDIMDTMKEVGLIQ